MVWINSIGNPENFFKGDLAYLKVWNSSNKLVLDYDVDRSTKNSATSKAEVIKITDSFDADRTVQNDPGLYYKSGPFILN